MPVPILYHKKFDQLNDEEKRLLEINKKSISDFVEQSSIISDVNYATRSAHAKTYAVLKGKFHISSNVPEYLQPFFDADTYDLIIRLSNAHLKIKKNKGNTPAYGFSVKMKDTQGNILANYPLANFPLFPIHSVSTFLKLYTAINQIFIKKWRYVFPLMIQTIKVLPDIITLSFLKNSIKLVKKRNDFILSFDYYSVGVYRLGEYMIKIKVNPISVEKKLERKITTQQAIENYFNSHEYTAEVLIQVCCDLKDQPINQLNCEWKNAPFTKIGEIRIEKNTLVDSHSCENELLSFNPFESKTIFQPVGKIQKIRSEAYKISVQTRHKINKLLHG